MDIFRAFLDTNSGVILFIYGLIFFTLGLIIALQSRRYSQLELARSLKWLAAFGFVHGVHEWGELFIPIQAAYLEQNTIQFLYFTQLILLSVSFAFLLEFGITMLRPLGQPLRPKIVSASLWLVWLTITLITYFIYPDNFLIWRNTSNAIARYLIGFTGSVIAAYGLHQQTIHRIAPLNVPNIVNTMRVSVLCLFLYAIFGGLIPPPVPFFPGNVLNTVTFTQFFGFPPYILRSITGLILSLTIFRALEVFDVENARKIEHMEQQQILSNERERIGRELHDGAIQTIYTAGLLVESAQKIAEPDSKIDNRLSTAVEVINDAIRDLRRNVDELRPSPSTTPLDLALEELIGNNRLQSMVDVDTDINLNHTKPLSPIQTDHILAIANEALSNVVRHANATKVTINVEPENDSLNMYITDNGVGLPQKVNAGYGLRNMRDRARLLGGQLRVINANNEGTRVILEIPLTDKT